MNKEVESPHEDDAPPPSVGPERLVKAFGYSLAGIAATWRHEGAFRQEVFAALILVPTAFLLPVTAIERVLLVSSVVLVMVVELLNSSIECAVDRISLERHPMAKRAKDTGSAAVMVSLAIPLITWGSIAGPLLLTALGRP
jgi:diacylglycerol kinase (ATP)